MKPPQDKGDKEMGLSPSFDDCCIGGGDIGELGGDEFIWLGFVGWGSRAEMGCKTTPKGDI